MNDEKLKVIMETFAGLNHGDQVDLFVSIKDALLKNRQLRIQEHEKEVEFQRENVKALCNGNDIITGNNSVAVKAG